MLKRGQHEIYRKIYWITKYSKKVWLEKNLNKKYSCWLRKIKMSGKSSPEFQWTNDEIQLLLEATQNLKVEDYKKTTRFYSRPTIIYVLVFLHSVVSLYKKLSLLYWTLNSKSYPIIFPDMFPLAFRSGSIAIQYASYHFQNWSARTPLPYENHAEKNMFQWKQKV